MECFLNAFSIKNVLFYFSLFSNYFRFNFGVDFVTFFENSESASFEDQSRSRGLAGTQKGPGVQSPPIAECVVEEEGGELTYVKKPSTT